MSDYPYLDLLSKCVTRELFLEDSNDPDGSTRLARSTGSDWPADAETMIGSARMNQLVHALIDVSERGVPGDFIETGVWRGGAAIVMAGALRQFADSTRRVWVADSFAGLPLPDPDRYPSDAGLDLTVYPQLSIGRAEVEKNFSRYGLLSDQIKFLEGWFEDTLPAAPIEQLSILRLDGDLYSSTIQALEALYPKLSVGGYCIVDDYGWHETCSKAVNDYRTANGITDTIEPIDWTGSYWIRTA